MLSKNANFSMPIEELVNIYCLYILSVAEQSSVVWSSSLTQGQDYDLERVQKVALRIIVDEDYHSYEHSLLITGLKTLKERRSDLSLNFALKCTKNERSKSMFPLRRSCVDTRRPEMYQVSKSRTCQVYLQSLQN